MQRESALEECLVHQDQGREIVLVFYVNRPCGIIPLCRRKMFERDVLVFLVAIFSLVIFNPCFERRLGGSLDRSSHTSFGSCNMYMLHFPL